MKIIDELIVKEISMQKETKLEIQTMQTGIQKVSGLNL